MSTDPAGGHRPVDMRGTIAMLVIIGVTILVVWFGVFLLFLSRN